MQRYKQWFLVWIQMTKTGVVPLMYPSIVLHFNIVGEPLMANWFQVMHLVVFLYFCSWQLVVRSRGSTDWQGVRLNQKDVSVVLNVKTCEGSGQCFFLTRGLVKLEVQWKFYRSPLLFVWVKLELIPFWRWLSAYKDLCVFNDYGPTTNQRTHSD